MQEKLATGRRKTAVASVRLRSGEGSIKINKRPFEDYFPMPELRNQIMEPFQIAGGFEGQDLCVSVKGGGIQAQAMAMRHALARLLAEDNEELHSALKHSGFLTRDPRKKERKKYGQPGARKRFQFSKR